MENLNADTASQSYDVKFEVAASEIDNLSQ